MVNINLNTLISCSSTNDLAFQGALDGLDEGNSFLSYSQTKGRGRNDNKWTSLKGNLFLSTIIRPKIEKKNWQQLSLIVAFSVIEVLLKFGIKKNQIELKWPNDILVNNKKIAGILLESFHDFIIVGIGLNVKKTPVNEEKWETTKIDDYINLNFSLKEIALKILDQLFLNYQIWNEKKFIYFREKINTFLKYRTKVIVINLNSNKNNLSGILLGLGDTGAMMIESGSSVFEYNSIESYYQSNEGV